MYIINTLKLESLSVFYITMIRAGKNKFISHPESNPPSFNNSMCFCIQIGTISLQILPFTRKKLPRFLTFIHHVYNHQNIPFSTIKHIDGMVYSLFSPVYSSDDAILWQRCHWSSLLPPQPGTTNYSTIQYFSQLDTFNTILYHVYYRYPSWFNQSRPATDSPHWFHN